ncbi:MAG: type II secretion system F family protein [Acinetobacter sp.]
MLYLYLILFIAGMLLLFFSLNRGSKDIDFLRKTETKNVTANFAYYKHVVTIKNKISDIYHVLIGANKKTQIENVLVIFIFIVAAQVGNAYLSILDIYMCIPLSTITISYLMFIRNKKIRKVTFEIEFLEALNVINTIIMSGGSILHAIEVCGQKVSGTVGKELTVVHQKLSYGEDPKSAFMQSYYKMPYKEYYFFVTAVLNNLKSGGQLKKTMSNIIAVISNSRIIEKKKIAKTSEVRTSVKVLAAIPCLFIVFLKYQNPEGFRILVEDPIGKLMFYYSIGSVLLGLVILWSMMNKI